MNHRQYLLLFRGVGQRGLTIILVGLYQNLPSAISGIPCKR